LLIASPYLAMAHVSQMLHALSSPYSRMAKRRRDTVVSPSIIEALKADGGVSSTQ